MAHPNCALARHPAVPPVEDNPSDNARSHRATLSLQAVGEINALREAYHAAACIHSLVVAARSARDDDAFTTSADSRALLTLVNAEFERRLQLAKATIAAMQSH
jgi:hypothetical protein